MSDPVTNVQIEDVLSSIRKLVSEEVRAQTKLVKQPGEPPRQTDKLVLTPALRVTDAPGDQLSETDGDDPYAGDDADADASLDFDDDEAPDDGDAPTGDRATALQGDGDFDIVAFRRAHLQEDAPAAADEAPQDESGFTEADALDLSGDFDLAEELGLEDDLGYEDEGSNVAEPMSRAYDPNNDDVEVDTPDIEDFDIDGMPAAGALAEPDDLASGPEDHGLSFDMSGDDLPAQEDEGPGDDPAPAFLHRAPRPESPIPSFLRARGVSSLEDRIAGLENEVSATGAEFTPRTLSESEGDGAFADDGDQALPWEDHTGAPDDDQFDPVGHAPRYDDLPLRPDPVRDDFDDSADAPEENGFLGDEAPMIDEEMLRDLVAEIVRQELQGALGERITRNVRKLVRREIQRALTAHDLL